MKREDAGYDFTNLTIKKLTARHFREFARGLERTNTDVLQEMIYFFEGYKISPYDTLDSHLERVENTFKKRLNAMISIIKDIEKRKMDPTHEMLQLLFEEARGQAEILNEKHKPAGIKGMELPQPSFEKHEALIKAQQREPIDGYTYYREQYVEQQKRLLHLQRMWQKALKDSKYVSPTFGSGYVRLELTQSEYETLKQQVYVSDHHTTENRE